METKDIEKPSQIKQFEKGGKTYREETYGGVVFLSMQIEGRFVQISMVRKPTFWWK